MKLAAFVDLFSSARELFYPPVCLLCNVPLPKIEDMQLCTECRTGLAPIEEPYCQCCGTMFTASAGGNHFCSDCLAKKFIFSRARAVLKYNSFSSDLIHSFKYGGHTSVYSTFKALWQQSCARNDLSPYDLVLPVPLHVDRLRQRGFNQALLLAEIFFSDAKGKIDPYLLTRPVKTTLQTGLSGKERRLNLRDSLSVKNPESIHSKRIIVVDDVFTTGTTLNECARVLIRAGAEDVQVVTLARVVK